MPTLSPPVDQSTQRWLNANGFEQLKECRALGGDSISSCYLLGNTQSDRVVVKLYPAELAGGASKEADGLQHIADTQSIATPEILYVDEQAIILEHLEASLQHSDYWTLLASGLADMHRHEPAPGDGTEFGLAYDNFCGSSVQCNGWFEDGHEFFIQQRLLLQARRAFDAGLLESPWVIHIESICERLPELIPAQPPSLLHGDLWPGNILVDSNGLPALIDPAIYFGWREADLAMTLLFGGLPHEFYLAYEEAWPMETQWRSRMPLYNLYHLLNHLNLFGSSYLEQVQSTISRYA